MMSFFFYVLFLGVDFCFGILYFSCWSLSVVNSDQVAFVAHSGCCKTGKIPLLHLIWSLPPVGFPCFSVVFVFLVMCSERRKRERTVRMNRLADGKVGRNEGTTVSCPVWKAEGSLKRNHYDHKTSGIKDPFHAASML
ncbi:hypothetical protein QBC32DRAFT_138795 [Pseudoneurospora amorphoporcata]|uniref:Uncharacterized protein n=1 Tax=Pseudoneurospora amorphoporcata TaxID=241081 RepID=A0AAN6SGH8_9PEZI|nr:hypothetical protein QBC32DRAFT_138795 [Pseudoneurospora amorphoporcata]